MAISDHGRGLEIVGEADSLQSAAALLANARPDVVVLDSSLPGTGGLSVLRQLLRRHPERLVLVLSAQIAEDFAAEAFAAGVSHRARAGEPASAPAPRRRPRAAR